MKLFILAIGACLLSSALAKKMKFAKGDYSIEWKLKSRNTIQFKIKAKTKGWVGVGFNKKGKDTMKGADMVIGWVEDKGKKGKGHITDRHGVGDTFAPKDSRSDVRLVEWKRDSKSITIKFTRRLNTNDKKQDFRIDKKELELLWAFGDNVPKHDDDIKIHKKRGHKTVRLISKGQKIDVRSSASAPFVGVTLTSIATVLSVGNVLW